MYRKSEVFYIDSILKFTKYTIDSPNVSAWLYDNLNRKDLYQLELVATPTHLLFNNQFSVDLDKNELIFSSNLIGQYVRVEYYSYGDINPYYATSDIAKFIRQVLLKASNNISSGIYFYQEPYDTEHIWRVAHGSFIYNGEFFVYNGQVLNFKELAPPTLENYCRCYYFFINEEILSDKVNNQTNTLLELGMIKSEMYEEFDKAKLDTLMKYDKLYQSEPLNVGWMYLIVEQKTGNYEFWVEYDHTVRTTTI